MRRPLRIAVVFCHESSFDCDLLVGVREYARTKHDWSLVPLPAEARAIRTERCRRCDALIGHLYRRDLAEEVMTIGLPTVTVSGLFPELPIPRVSSDHTAIGQLAAEHFLERGYRQFAFVGYHGREFSSAREAAFLRRLRADGLTAERFVFRERQGRHATDHLLANGDVLGSWLVERPRPLAVFAANSVLGFRTSVACQESGLRVPDDVALLGVDNDELQSQLCSPPNSSIALPTHSMGYEGAKLLDLLMSGRTLQTTSIVLPPLGVVVRQSSDALAIQDEDVARAAKFIRQRENMAISASDVIRQVDVSRRTLERKFRSLVGHSIAEEIRSARRERAKTLLASSDVPMARVAERAGFSGNVELSVDFRKNLGLTPSEYRQRFRIDGRKR